MKTDFMIAKFIGQNGSMGFANGRQYELTVEIVENYVRITSKGVGKPDDKVAVPYDTVGAFLKNWDVIKIL